MRVFRLVRHWWRMRHLRREGAEVARRILEASERHWRHGCSGDFGYFVTEREMLALASVNGWPRVWDHGKRVLIFQTPYHQVRILQCLADGYS